MIILKILLGIVALYCVVVWSFTLIVGLRHKKELEEVSWLNAFLSVLFSPVTFLFFLRQDAKEQKEALEGAEDTMDGWAKLMEIPEEEYLMCDSMEEFRNLLRSPVIQGKVIVPPAGEQTLLTPLEINCEGCIIPMVLSPIKTSLVPAVVITGKRNMLLGMSLVYPAGFPDLETIPPVSTIGDTPEGFVASIPNSFALLADLSVEEEESNEENV